MDEIETPLQPKNQQIFILPMYDYAHIKNAKVGKPNPNNYCIYWLALSHTLTS